MLTCQKHLFQLPEAVTYLNCAYLSPQLKSVETAGHAAVSRKNLPFTVTPEDFFTDVIKLKLLFAQLVNTKEAARIAIIPSVSYGIATVAKNMNIKFGENIIIVEDQFPSNVYSWQQLAKDSGATLRVVKAPNSNNRTQAWNEAILNSIDAQTRLVALGNVHWADGTRFDLMAIREKTLAVGALLVIDGTQSVGALPLDVSALQPDALICAGYKWLLGPYSLGVAYYGPYFDNGIPIEENWINRYDSENFRNLVNYQAAYQPGVGRYSMGEQSNFILVPMLIAALEQILAWGVATIQDYTRQLTQQPLEVLRNLGCQIESEAERCGHLFGIRIGFEQFDVEKLSRLFVEQQVYISLRGNAIRVAPHVYNNPDDLLKLILCFEQASLNVYH